MTKKDYIIIAKTLKKIKEKINLDDGYIMINIFSKMLKKENVRFDRIKFNEMINS